MINDYDWTVNPRRTQGAFVDLMLSTYPAHLTCSIYISITINLQTCQNHTNTTHHQRKVLQLFSPGISHSACPGPTGASLSTMSATWYESELQALNFFFSCLFTKQCPKTEGSLCSHSSESLLWFHFRSFHFKQSFPEPNCYLGLPN
jgi:hypothetical protein